MKKNIFVFLMIILFIFFSIFIGIAVFDIFYYSDYFYEESQETLDDRINDFILSAGGNTFNTPSNDIYHESFNRDDYEIGDKDILWTDISGLQRVTMTIDGENYTIDTSDYEVHTAKDWNYKVYKKSVSGFIPIETKRVYIWANSDSPSDIVFTSKFHLKDSFFIRIDNIRNIPEFKYGSSFNGIKASYEDGILSLDWV